MLINPIDFDNWNAAPGDDARIFVDKIIPVLFYKFENLRSFPKNSGVVTGRGNAIDISRNSDIFF